MSRRRIGAADGPVLPAYGLMPLRTRSRSPRLAGAAARLPNLARRLVYFLIVWTALLLVHEGGHAFGAWRQGLDVRRVTVGIGPVVWSGARGATEFELRALPIAGVTSVRDARGALAHDHPGTVASPSGRSTAIDRWAQQLATLGAGVLATLSLGGIVAGLVLVRERATGRAWTLGRWIVADAMVLTVFNFLPVPPLDGGRAMLGIVALLRGAPITGDTLFWVQVGGMALAIVPMTLWTRWTARIDAAALRWGLPTARA